MLGRVRVHHNFVLDRLYRRRPSQARLSRPHDFRHHHMTLRPRSTMLTMLTMTIPMTRMNRITMRHLPALLARSLSFLV